MTSNDIRPEDEAPKIYTSRYKRSERVLKTIFVVLFVLLAIWILKIIFLDAPTVSINSYNPRLDQIEEKIDRGTIYDRNGKVLAETVKGDDGMAFRSYPYKSALGLVTGYCGQSKSGLEEAMNEYLLKPNSMWDAFRYWFLDQKVEGCDVITTLDGELSAYGYELLGNYNGAIVMSDAATGEVLCLVSKESYDPNTVLADWDALMENDQTLFFNRATQGLYPPGSTFKIITALAWLHSEEYDPDFYYECAGFDYFDEYELPCIGYSAHGPVGIEDAFAQSCNTFFATLGVRMGAQQLVRMMKQIGFEEDFAFPMPTAVSSHAIGAQTDDEELSISSIGQGTVAMTPLALNRLTGAIASGGIAHDYLLLDKVVNKRGKSLESYGSQGEERLMSEADAAFLTRLMEGVTEYGTASFLSELPCPVYGKTGTAENETDRSHSWFTGFMEGSDGHPITVTVLVEQSGGGLSASAVAGKMLEYVIYGG